MAKNTALRRYLKKSKTTQQQLAESISTLRGWVCSQPQVSRWVNGTHIPNREARRYIAQATKGEVPVDVW